MVSSRDGGAITTVPEVGALAAHILLQEGLGEGELPASETKVTCCLIFIDK